MITDIVLDLLKGDGSINGTVVDGAGAAVPGAPVTASDGTNDGQHGDAVANDVSGAGAGSSSSEPDHARHVLARRQGGRLTRRRTSPCASTPAASRRRR